MEAARASCSDARPPACRRRRLSPRAPAPPARQVRGRRGFCAAVLAGRLRRRNFRQLWRGGRGGAAGRGAAGVHGRGEQAAAGPVPASHARAGGLPRGAAACLPAAGRSLQPAACTAACGCQHLGDGDRRLPPPRWLAPAPASPSLSYQPPPPCRRPPAQEARLRDLMGDLHECFKERVRVSRGDRLAVGRDEELFSGGRLAYGLAGWVGADGW